MRFIIDFKSEVGGCLNVRIGILSGLETAVSQ